MTGYNYTLSVAGADGKSTQINIQSAKPIKTAVKDFYTLMKTLMFAVAQGSGTVEIDGALYDVSQPGTMALADFKINEASQGIQFVLKEIAFENDLDKQAGQIS